MQFCSLGNSGQQQSMKRRLLPKFEDGFQLLLSAEDDTLKNYNNYSTREVQ